MFFLSDLNPARPKERRMQALAKSLIVITLAAFIGGCATATVIKETGRSKVIQEEPLTASDAGIKAN